jgi:hypothetical protein
MATSPLGFIRNSGSKKHGYITAQENTAISRGEEEFADFSSNAHT